MKLLIYCLCLCIWTLFFPFVIRYSICSVPNMYDAQRGTLYFRSRNRLGGLKVVFIHMDLGCKWYNLSWQDLNSCCKGESTSRNTMFSFFLAWGSWIHCCIPLKKLGLMQFLSHYLIWRITWWLTLCFRARTWFYALCSRDHWYLYPPALPHHCDPTLCIWNIHQFGSMGLDF